MRSIIPALAALCLASAAYANPVPVTNTSKNPYKPSKVYCNDALIKPSAGENIACYNHDACYSDPQGRTRGDCDDGYLADMKKAGLGTSGYFKYRALRSWGKAAWQRCRAHDKRKAAN
jgi:hypothetical protein